MSRSIFCRNCDTTTSGWEESARRQRMPRGEVSPGLVIGIAAAVVVLGAVAFLAFESGSRSAGPAPAANTPAEAVPGSVQPAVKSTLAIPTDETALMYLVRRLDKKLEGNQYQEITGAMQGMGKKAVPILVQWLQSGEQQKASSAAVVISIIKSAARDATVQAELAKWIQTPTRKERDMAILALCSIGPDPKEAVPLLAGLLEEKDSDVREMAVTGLGALGPDAKAAAPALTKLLRSQTQNNEPSAMFTEQALARVNAAPGTAPDAAAIMSKAHPGDALFAGPVDYLDVLPANAIMAGQLRDLGKSIETAKQSAIGQLLQSAPLAAFREKLDAALQEKPDAWKKFVTWAGRFQGQFAVAVWELNFQDPSAVRIVAMAEITDPAPQAVLDDFLQETAMFRGVPETETYRGVSILKQMPAGPAVALAGRHLLLSTNVESIKRVITGFAVPGAGLSATPAFAKIRSLLGATAAGAPGKDGGNAAQPELLFLMDYEAYAREIGKSMGAAMGPKEAEAIQNVMASAGNMKLLAMASASAGEGFEDRYVVTFNGAPKGFAAATHMPPDAPPPLNALALVPPNAALATAGYMNGAELHTAALEYLGALQKMMKAMPRPPQAANQPGFPDIDAVLKAFEEKSGLNVKELIANVKGEFGYYVAPAPGLVTTAPDIGVFFTHTAPEKAKAFSAAVATALNAYMDTKPVKEMTVGNRVLYQLDLNALGVAVRENFPYTPCWTVDGNRILAASSPQALRKQLTFIDSKTPGLLKQPEFEKALGTLAPEARKGQIVYADAKTLLSAAAMLGLPLLQARLTDADMKAALAGLPPAQQLFKDIPPLVGATVQGDGHAETVLRSPLPPLSTGVVLAVGALLTVRQAMPPPAPPREEPPGKF